MSKLYLILVLVAFVRGNSYADEGEWKFVHRRLSIDPDFKANPFKSDVKSGELQGSEYGRGTSKVEGCGVTPTPIKNLRIHGGNETDPREYPWTSGIFIDNLYFCNGALISNEWVITSASCVYGTAATSVNIILGTGDLTSNEPTKEVITASQLVIHEDWNPITLTSNIALIKLSNPVVFNDFIRPICLPNEPDLGSGVPVTISGWSTETGSYGVKVSGEGTTISNEDCGLFFGTSIGDNAICVANVEGGHVCSMGPGTPLNYLSEGITELRGLSSFGSSAGCDVQLPGVFTRVSHYLGWIQDNAGISA